MSDSDRHEGLNRRKVLECMTWVGTGVLWTVSGRVPRSWVSSIKARGGGNAWPDVPAISDSHVGFDKPANPNALGTLEEAVGRIKAMPTKPAFMILYRRHQPSVEAF